MIEVLITAMEQGVVLVSLTFSLGTHPTLLLPKSTSRFLYLDMRAKTNGVRAKGAVRCHPSGGTLQPVGMHRRDLHGLIMIYYQGVVSLAWTALQEERSFPHGLLLHRATCRGEARDLIGHPLKVITCSYTGDMVKFDGFDKIYSIYFGIFVYRRIIT